MKTQTIDASKAHELIEAFAPKADIRFIEVLAPGEAIRQGDLYLISIPPYANPGKGSGTRQLAPGETQGSRHIVEGDVDVITVTTKDPLIGPVVVGKSRFTLTHPEHAHFSMPAGCYQVRYQRDYAAEEVARMRD